MKILLTGRNGQLGWELQEPLEQLGSVLATDRSTLDVADGDAIRRVVREVRPDLIVNAAAYTAVDRAQSEPELARRINAVAPSLLAEEAKRLGVRLVHFSTDYVFDGRKSSPYLESDPPNPLGVYGRTKLEGDERIGASGCRYLVLRTSWVYGPRATNFYRMIERKALAGEPIRMVDDQRSVPTPARFLARHAVALVKSGAEGLLNLVPSGDASRYEFACEVVRVLGSRSAVEAAKSAEFPSPAPRPAHSVLDNGKAAGLLGGALPDWRAALADMRESAALQ